MHTETVGTLNSRCGAQSEPSSRHFAVVRIAQRDHVVVAGVSARHEQGEIIRFRTGIYEITNFQVARHFRRQLLCILSNVRMQINRGGMLENFVFVFARPRRRAGGNGRH